MDATDTGMLPAASGSCLPISQRPYRKMDGCAYIARKRALTDAAPEKLRAGKLIRSPARWNECVIGLPAMILKVTETLLKWMETVLEMMGTLPKLAETLPE